MLSRLAAWRVDAEHLVVSYHLAITLAGLSTAGFSGLALFKRELLVAD